METKGKIFWLKEVDLNTKFFHAQASKRKKMNSIAYSITESGDIIDDHDAMCSMTVEYFKKVFDGNCEGENSSEV